MIYRDNYCEITTGEMNVPGTKHQLVSGSYDITWWWVTDGQDPKRYNYVGLRKNFSSNGKFSFKVGRKGRSAIAGYWHDYNPRIPAGNTTFNKRAGRLNFGLKGVLTLRLKGGALGDTEHEFKFKDVALAQGRTGSSNNWWFGGVHCKHIGNDTVDCRGVDVSLNNLPISMSVTRGRVNSVNEFDFRGLRMHGLASWMSKIPGAARLDQIVMPGCHNAGMWEARNCNPNSRLTKNNAINQKLRIIDQLKCGARYLEVRVDYDKGRLITYHRNGNLGCSGAYLETVLEDVRSFIASRPSEVVILKFSHIRNNAASTKLLVEQMLEGYESMLYKNSTAGVNLTKLSLEVLRGKVLCVFDYSDHISPGRGRFRYTGQRSGGNLSVYDRYSNTGDYRNMSSDQLGKWRSEGGLGQGFFFLLSWTLTPAALEDIKKLAAKANDPLHGVLGRYCKAYGKKPNVVFVDFLDEDVATSIILQNFISKN